MIWENNIKEITELAISQGKTTLPPLRAHVRAFITLQIQDKNIEELIKNHQFSHIIKFESALYYLDTSIKNTSLLEFQVPFNITLKKLKGDYLTAQIENCTNMNLNILNAKLKKCKVIEILTELPCKVFIRQILYLVFIVKNLDELEIILKFCYDEKEGTGKGAWEGILQREVLEYRVKVEEEGQGEEICMVVALVRADKDSKSKEKNMEMYLKQLKTITENY